MGLSRRDFVKWAAYVAAASGLPSCIRKRLPPLTLDEAPDLRPMPGPETWSPALCNLCPAGCGMKVRQVEGKPIRLAGNPRHPVSQGALCPRGLAGLQLLYHPDRLRTPLKRAGKRGEGKWESIDWEEALDQVAERLRALRSKGRPQGAALLTRPASDLTRLLSRRLLETFGSPNDIEDPAPLGPSPVDALYAMQGIRGRLTYDLAYASYILSFGADWLQASESPVETTRAFAQARRGQPEARAKLVQVEARFSVTASKADEWIPVRPGMEGLLAMGMASTLLRSGVYDRDFVEQQCFGFHDWTDSKGSPHLGFARFALDNYSPEEVAEATGVSIRTLERVALEFASAKPAVALAGRLPLYDQMAVHSLNALTGSIEGLGGTLGHQEGPLASLPELPLDAVAIRGLSLPRVDGLGEGDHPLASELPYQLPEHILQRKPYPIDTIIVHGANPLFLHAGRERWERALEEIPLVVAIGSFLDETARFADLVLPEFTLLEQWQDAHSVSLEGHRVFAAAAPVIRPLYDTRSAGDVFIALARRLGSPVAEAFPWKSFEEALEAYVKAIYGTYGSALASSYSDFPSFRRAAFEAGVSLPLPFTAGRESRPFATPSGKFEFFSQIVRARLGNGAGDEDCLPHPSAVSSSAEVSDFPLQLYLFAPLGFSGGEGAHVPFLQDLAGPHLRERWESWVEINPDTARELGIGDREWVFVESGAGRLRARARFYAGAMPGVVNMAVGLGHQGQGRWAAGVGANPLELLLPSRDRLAGYPLWQAGRVRVYAA